MSRGTVELWQNVHARIFVRILMIRNSVRNSLLILELNIKIVCNRTASTKIPRVCSNEQVKAFTMKTSTHSLTFVKHFLDIWFYQVLLIMAFNNYSHTNLKKKRFFFQKAFGFDPKKYIRAKLTGQCERKALLPIVTYTLTKVRPLFTLLCRRSDNSPWLIMFRWTSYELCICILRQDFNQ